MTCNVRYHETRLVVTNLNTTLSEKKPMDIQVRQKRDLDNLTRYCQLFIRQIIINSHYKSTIRVCTNVCCGLFFFGLSVFITVPVGRLSHDKGLVITESPDDRTLIIIVNKGGSPGCRTVMSGSELPEPCSHSPVAVGKVAKTSSKKAHNNQDPYYSANSTFFLNCDGARGRKKRYRQNGLSRPAVGREAPLRYGNNSYTESLVPASSREAGIEQGAGSKIERSLPGGKSHFASLVLKVWIRAEHHLIAFGLARGGPRD